MRRPLGPEPKRTRQHVRLEDRLEQDLHGGLHDAVADRGDRERSQLGLSRFGYVHPPGWQRLEPSLTQFRFQLVEQPGNPVALDIGDGGLVDARCAAIAPHQHPRPPQHVPAVDFVIKRMEPSPGVGLGRPVKLALQGTDRVEDILGTRGGTSHGGTHRPLLLAHAWTKQRPFPSPAVVLSVRLDRYYGRLRLPAGWSPTSPLGL